MKINNIKDPKKFYEVIDSCVGKVELVSKEGDRLNLKSKLSQYITLATLFSTPEIGDLDIIAYEKEDIQKIMEYLING